MKVIGHSSLRAKLLRAAAEKKLHPVSIFGGPHSIGKRTTALGIAQFLVCEKPITSPSLSACQTCGPCVRVNNGQSEALLVITPTSAQLKIEDVRPVHEFLRHQSWTHARVVIVDDAHLLNPTAANHLLKILEEPPAGAFFFLVTDHPHTLLPTIRSRSQIFRFGLLSAAEVQEITGAPEWVVKASYGRVDMAKRLAEEGEENLRADALQLIQSLLEPSFTRYSQLLKEKLRDRAASVQALGYAQQILRDTCDSGADQISSPSGIQQRFPQLSISEILRLFSGFVTAERDIDANVDRQVAIERLWFDFHETQPRVSAGRS